MTMRHASDLMAMADEERKRRMEEGPKVEPEMAAPTPVLGGTMLWFVRLEGAVERDGRIMRRNAAVWATDAHAAEEKAKDAWFGQTRGTMGRVKRDSMVCKRVDAEQSGVILFS